MPVVMSDLLELKTLLEIAPSNHAEDASLLLFLSTASEWIAEILNRPGLFLASRTEFYDGTNTHTLLLRSRPVFTDPTIQVWRDDNGYWGQSSGGFASNTQLTYGTDFVLQIDQADGSSRSGILYRRKGVWPKKWSREQGWLTPFVSSDTGSIKVTYSGGYTIDSLPAQLRFACNLLASKIRFIMPDGFIVSSESYEERSLNLDGDRKDALLAGVKDMVMSYRNHHW